MPDEIASPETEETAVPAGPPPQPWTEPECSLDWSGALLPAPFLVALARAQGAAKTLGKTARAEAGAGAPAYDYTTNDALVGELRRVMSAEGISFVSSYRVLDRPWPTISEKQWLDWTVVLDFALLYGDAEGNVGKLCGTASCVAIGSAGRPPDKSLFAARTSLAGAAALGLGALDRAKVLKDEDTQQRNEDETASGSRRVTRAESKAHTAAHDRLAHALRVLTSARKAAGLPRLGYPELIEEAMGEGYRPKTADEADTTAEALEQAARDLIGDGDPT